MTAAHFTVPTVVVVFLIMVVACALWWLLWQWLMGFVRRWFAEWGDRRQAEKICKAVEARREPKS